MLKKIIALTIVFSLALSIMILPNTASAKTTKEKLNDVEQQIDSKKGTLNSKEDTANILITEIDDYETAIDELTKTISAQEEKQTSLEKQLATLQDDLKEAKEKKVKYQDLFSERMETMYMYGNTGYLDLIFSSESFSDLISKIITVQSLVSYDQNIISELEDIETEITTKTNKVASDKKELETLVSNLEKNKETMNMVKVAKNADLTNVNGDINSLKKEIESLEAKQEAYSNQLSAESAQKTDVVYEENTSSNDNKNNNSSSNSSGSSSSSSSSGSGSSSSSSSSNKLLWPAPGNYTVTSEQGSRYCPYHGYETHSGMDIALSVGDRVVAPASGKITQAGWNGGYGISVTIDAGNIKGKHVVILLGHNSRAAVSVGQTVKKGQVVAYGGSTGNSTGPHCHFEVHANGVLQNPRNWL